MIRLFADWDFRQRAIDVISRQTLSAYPEEIYRELSIGRKVSPAQKVEILFWRRQIELEIYFLGN